MQVRIDCHQPIHVPRQQPSEGPRRDRFAALEAPILTHVREVRRNEADSRGSEFARRVGQKDERKQLVVRPIECTDQDNALLLAPSVNAEVRFTVWETPRLDNAQRNLCKLADPPGEGLALPKRQDDCGHGISPIATISGCTARYSWAYDSSPGVSACSVNSGCPASTFTPMRTWRSMPAAAAGGGPAPFA